MKISFFFKKLQGQMYMVYVTALKELIYIIHRRCLILMRFCKFWFLKQSNKKFAVAH